MHKRNPTYFSIWQRFVKILKRCSCSKGRMFAITCGQITFDLESIKASKYADFRLVYFQKIGKVALQFFKGRNDVIRITS